MASGIGVNGNVGRCYPIWLDFTKCMGDAALPKDCKNFRDDYIECLHHRKEVERRVAVDEEAARQEKAAAEAKKAAAAAAKKAGQKPPS